MIVLDDIEQGTEEWRKVRCKCVTASEMHRILTPAGKIADSKRKDQAESRREGYLNDLLAEWLSGEPIEAWDGNRWTERGKALEPEARDFLAFKLSEDIAQVGFCYKDETRLVGCSPDGLIGYLGDGKTARAGAEIKVLKSSTHMRVLLKGVLPVAHKVQVYGSLLVSDLEIWHFLAYHPTYPFYLRVERDERFIRELDIAVRCFTEEMLELREAYRRQGYYPEAELAAMEA